MKEIYITLSSRFIFHGHLQHAWVSCGATTVFWYLLYFIPANVGLLDAIAFAYGWSLRNDGIQSADNELSAPNVTMEENDEGLSNVGDVGELEDYMLCGDDIFDDDY